MPIRRPARMDQCAFLKPFSGVTVTPPPIWLMRQAGRYLPEYRTVRAEAGSFLDLCYSPKLAAEVTLQPIRRFGFDAAILFSDILVVPHALGQQVSFAEGEGPVLEPIRSIVDLSRLDQARTPERFGLVFETVARVRDKLPAETALIGFCGGPWTVATYMVGGRGSPDQADARLWAYRDPVGFARLIDLVTEVSIAYLSGQILAGADTVQLFDSWAGSLPGDELERWVIAPTRRIVDEISRRHPQVPIIGFPRGAGVHVPHYVDSTGVDGIGCDTTMPLPELKERIADLGVVMQGNLDPLLLVAGGEAMERRVREILSEAAGAPFIFNLGHGIVPQTPPQNVARLVEIVRSERIGRG
ncbi:MAG: uroporphyrinogen decarboxylase [Hyphomicrobiaceae bacterium]